MSSVLALVSGMAALACEMLWQRLLSNVLGDTIFVSSLVVIVFFVSLSLGAAFLRRLSMMRQTPWLLYGLLQVAVTLFITPSLLFWRFGWSLEIESASYASSLGSALAVVLLLIGCPTFFMGGTLLALIEGAGIQRPGRLSVLYGINTLGGTVGIALSTFYSCYAWGVYRSFMACMGMFGVMGLSAFAVHAVQKRPIRSSDLEDESELYLPLRFVWAAWTSGFAVLGFEMILMTAYAQVGQNSAWSLAAVLMLVISVLGVAALLVSVLRFDRCAFLKFALVAGALGLSAFPHIFLKVTQGLRFESSSSGSLSAYMGQLLLTGFFSAGPGLLLAGLVFPLIMEIVHAKNTTQRSRALGWLLAVNALGAVTGVCVVEFELFPAIGLWRSCAVVASVMLFTAAIFEMQAFRRCQRISWGFVCALGLGLFCSVVCLCASLPQISLYKGETLLELNCGPEGIVGIKQRKDGKVLLTHNNHYLLSSSTFSVENKKMGHIPLLLHRDPKQVAYIGLATGATASASIEHAVESVTVLENSALVTKLSLKHFAQVTGGFHRDARVTIHVADGVHFFASSKKSFDVVIGDLFFPWCQGVSRLYSREHFANVKERLNPQGVFCQWLPGWQLNNEADQLISGTFAQVFPNAIRVHLVHANYISVALIGWKQAQGFNEEDINALWHERRMAMHDVNDVALLPNDLSELNRGRIVDYYDLSNISRTTSMDKPILEPIVIRLEPTL